MMMDANAPFVKTAFYQGSNHLAAPGGSRTPRISSLNDTITVVGKHLDVNTRLLAEIYCSL
jgi:hypothetical protein